MNGPGFKTMKMILLGVFQGLNHICLGSEAVMFKFRNGGRETMGVVERDVGSESGIQILCTIFCIPSITTYHVFV